MLINKNGIYYRKWQTKNSKAVILAVHGMGAHSERFAEMGNFFKTKRISVYALALRGFGELSQRPGYVEAINIYYKDIAILKEIIKSENSKKPIFIIGESMGALIAHMTVLDCDSNYKGLIEVVPVYEDSMKISLMKKILIGFTALFIPAKPILMPFKSEELSRDVSILKRLKSDKREHRFASAGLLLGILLIQIKAMLNTAKIKIPVLFLLAGKDYLGKNSSSLKLFNKLKCDKEYHLYKDSFHALTIEKNRKQVFGDIYSWINNKLTKDI